MSIKEQQSGKLTKVNLNLIKSEELNKLVRKADPDLDSAFKAGKSIAKHSFVRAEQEIRKIKDLSVADAMYVKLVWQLMNKGMLLDANRVKDKIRDSVKKGEIASDLNGRFPDAAYLAIEKGKIDLAMQYAGMLNSGAARDNLLSDIQKALPLEIEKAIVKERFSSADRLIAFLDDRTSRNNYLNVISLLSEAKRGNNN